MEIKICNTLLDMLGDWHDIIVELKWYYGEQYYKIIIDNELFYTIHKEMLSEEYFNYSIENLVFLYGSDIGMKIKKGEQ